MNRCRSTYQGHQCALPPDHTSDHVAHHNRDDVTCWPRATGRCIEMHNTRQCSLPAGHDGTHIASRYLTKMTSIVEASWPQDPAGDLSAKLKVMGEHMRDIGRSPEEYRALREAHAELRHACQELIDADDGFKRMERLKHIEELLK